MNQLKHFLESHGDLGHPWDTPDTFCSAKISAASPAALVACSWAGWGSKTWEHGIKLPNLVRNMIEICWKLSDLCWFQAWRNHSSATVLHDNSRKMNRPVDTLNFVNDRLWCCTQSILNGKKNRRTHSSSIHLTGMLDRVPKLPSQTQNITWEQYWHWLWLAAISPLLCS